MATEVVKVIDPDMGSGYDYDSLFDWEAAQQGDLTGARDEIAVAKCRCTGGTADTTAVNISGWTASATQFIKIWTDTAESYRHNGTYQTGNKYRLDVANNTALTTDELSVRADGLAVKISGSTNAKAGIANLFRITNCIIVNTSTGTGMFGINYASIVINCVIYDFSTASSYGIFADWLNPNKLYAYNNTIYNCTVGIRVGTSDTYHNAFLINNLVDACSSACFSLGELAITAYNNASSDATADDATYVSSGNRISQDFAYVNEAGDDFHLASNDAGALSYGLNLYNDATYPFQTDIDGQDRGGAAAAWDIGADEYVAAVVALTHIFLKQYKARRD